MSLCYKSITPRFLMLALALGLAAAAGLFQLLPAHAQTTNTPTITIATDQASVYEGGLAVFTLTRHGGNRRPITVQVKTWEPDHEDSSNQNETEQLHDVQFTQGSVIATLSVLSYIDTWRDVGDLELKAQVQSSTDGSYQVGSQDTATVEVVDLIGMEPPAGVTAIGLWSGQASVTEGWRDPLSFEVRRYGETSEPLSVDIMIEDPQEVLRGNHWDPPPLLPTQVEFAAGSTSETLLIPVPNDQRALSNAFFKVIVLPSTDYLIRKAGTGFELSERADVIDNDTAQELELNFGKDGVNDADVDEGDTLKFIVKRRQQDVGTGKTATFVVRVETNRSGADRLLEDWDGGHFHRPPLQGLSPGIDRQRYRGRAGDRRHRKRIGGEQLEILGVDKGPGGLRGQHPHRRPGSRVLDCQSGISGDDGPRHRQRSQHRESPPGDRPGQTSTRVSGPCSL